MLNRVFRLSGNAVLVSFLLAFLAFSMPIASAVPQLSINSPLNQTYYNTNQILVNITQVEASPEMLWYTFPQEDWPMFHENLNNTGYTDNFNPPELVKLWNYTTGSYIYSSPAIADGVVYVGSNDFNLYAFYLNGTKKWNYSTGDIIKFSSPAVSDGVVYVGSDDYSIYAIYTNGTLKWSYATGGRIYLSPTVADGVVYVGSLDTKLYAIYLNGTLKWSYTAGDFVATTPAISDDVVYFGSRDNSLYAIYMNGSLKWSYSTGGDVFSSPAVSDGVVYVGSWDDNLYAIYINGTLKWSYTTGDSIAYSSPAVSDGVVYIGSKDNKLHAVYTNGTSKWNYTTGHDIESSPAVADGVVYVGSADDKLHAIYTNGTLKWNYTTTWNIDSSPAISNGIVYVGGLDSNLYAFGDGSSTNSLSRTITLPYGSYELEVLSRDTNGDYNMSTVHFTLEVDVTPPTITIYSPENTTYDATSILLEVSANETADTWLYNLNGAGNVTFTPNTSITASEGSNRILVYANDSAGNVGSDEIYFTVELPTVEPTGIAATLGEAGSGLGGFLTAITPPVVDIILGLGIIGGIIVIFSGLAFAIRNALAGATKQISE